jgi:hypothetical protein
MAMKPESFADGAFPLIPNVCRSHLLSNAEAEPTAFSWWLVLYGMIGAASGTHVKRWDFYSPATVVNLPEIFLS